MIQWTGELLLQEPLADYTTWRVGGKAKQLYKPSNIADLLVFLKQLDNNEPLFWLGLGSNTLIRDSGFAGTVILTQNCLKNIAVVAPQLVRVEAGVSCATMARFCARNDLAGGEFWAGIPGTMGGALRMNAGCFGSETWQLVEEVETVNRRGELRCRLPAEFTIAYREVSGLAEDEWFVAATCRLAVGEKEKSLQVIKDLLAHRAATQPTSEYNCGSVFRNPPGQFAARLIESCGLKGKQWGNAIVSPKHANFIINQNGKATASDIESLIHYVRDTVQEKTAVTLVQEVHVF